MAQTEKVSFELTAIIRADIKARVKFYAKTNTGPMLWQRLNKRTPMPPMLPGDTKALRMMYTAMRFWILAHKDF